MLRFHEDIQDVASLRLQWMRWMRRPFDDHHPQSAYGGLGVHRNPTKVVTVLQPRSHPFAKMVGHWRQHLIGATRCLEHFVPMATDEFEIIRSDVSEHEH